MSTEQLNGYLLIAGTLIQLGTHTIAQIRSLFVHMGLSEAEIDQILTELSDDAKKRRAISAAIAFGA